MIYLRSVNMEHQSVYTHYFTWVLLIFQDDAEEFITLKCNIFANTPQVGLEVGFGIAIEYQIGVCNRGIVDKIVKF